MADTLFGAQVNPIAPKNIFSSLGEDPAQANNPAKAFLWSLVNNTINQGAGGYDTFVGLPGYQGQLNPDPQQTILPNVYANWQPWNQGTGYISNWLAGPQAGRMNPDFQTAMGNMAQYGGIGGYPTQLMHNMAQFGGTGGPGNYGMSYAMQYGAPSQAGQNVAQMAQHGVAGTWGGPLYNRATGGPTASSNYLAPFLMARPYQARWQ